MSRPRRRHMPNQMVRKLRERVAMLAAGKRIGEVCEAFWAGSNSRRFSHRFTPNAALGGKQTAGKASPLNGVITVGYVKHVRAARGS